MAASAPSLISTNPNPRDRPVSRSVITWARVTVPCCANSCSRSSDVVLNGRFPTYRFFATPHPRGATPRDTTERTSGRPRRPGGQYDFDAELFILGVCARQARDRRAKTGHNGANRTDPTVRPEHSPAYRCYYTALPADCNIAPAGFPENSPSRLLSSGTTIR